MAPKDSLGFDAERLGRLDAVLHRYVDDGRLPGVQTLISRRGQLVHRDCYGLTDIEAGTAVEEDTLYRIFSMTKPITSVALMMLFEEGHFLLEDPVSRWLPEFADLQVWTGGTADAPETRPLASPLTVHHVLTHTSGLTYGFQYAHPVDELYRRNGLGDFSTPTWDLAEGMRKLAALPLLFEPGTRWNYSMSTDVCGALVERMSGLTLDEFFRTRIFEPLGMTDTGFAAPASDLDRCSVLYALLPGMEEKIAMAPKASMTIMPSYLDGGGGLVSSSDDYLRFCHLLVGGGALGDVRLLSPRTLEFMALQPPARRADPQRHGPGHLRRGGDGGHRLRPGLLGARRPGGEPVAGLGGPVRLGRRGQHRLLDRSGGGPGGRLHDPAPPLERLPAPTQPDGRRLPGADRLTG